jgi:hypothetical protein
MGNGINRTRPNVGCLGSEKVHARAWSSAVYHPSFRKRWKPPSPSPWKAFQTRRGHLPAVTWAHHSSCALHPDSCLPLHTWPAGSLAVSDQPNPPWGGTATPTRATSSGSFALTNAPASRMQGERQVVTVTPLTLQHANFAVTWPTSPHRRTTLNGAGSCQRQATAAGRFYRPQSGGSGRERRGGLRRARGSRHLTGRHP